MAQPLSRADDLAAEGGRIRWNEITKVKMSLFRLKFIDWDRVGDSSPYHHFGDRTYEPVI